MTRMTRVIGFVAAMLLCGRGVLAQPAVAEGPPAKPVVQIAILLDTSNSMDGLIEQAKTQLWKVVNEFATASRDGRRPDLQVALYQYGTPSLGAQTGYIKQVLPLTGDLDKVSEELFKLTTNGGDEYCGQVIGKAVAELNWSPAAKDYKAIFIAGNEPFTQGSVDFHASCKTAIEKGIIVNTIFCGSNEEGARTSWKDGALLADGSYMSIDQNQKVVHIDAPQDKQIAALGSELNKTYVGYGVAATQAAVRQAAEDAHAAAAGPGSSVERAGAKASANYHNEGWDVVDALKQGKKLEEFKDAELPAEMQKLAPAERQAYVDAKAKEREVLQAKIAELKKQRDEYVAAEEKKATTQPANTLDAAMRQTLREQAGKKEIQFEGGK